MLGGHSAVMTIVSAFSLSVANVDAIDDGHACCCCNVCNFLVHESEFCIHLSDISCFAWIYVEGNVCYIPLSLMAKVESNMAVEVQVFLPSCWQNPIYRFTIHAFLPDMLTLHIPIWELLFLFQAQVASSPLKHAAAFQSYPLLKCAKENTPLLLPCSRYKLLMPVLPHIVGCK